MAARDRQPDLDEQRLDLEELLETVSSVFATEARLLVPAERSTLGLASAVDPNLTGADLAGDLLGPFVAARDAGGQTVDGVVGDLDRLLLGVVGHDRQDRPEDLFLSDGRVNGIMEVAAVGKGSTVRGRVTGRRWIAAMTVGVCVGSLIGAVPAAARPILMAPTISVGGQVSVRSTYTPAQLAALPQTTETVTVGGVHFTDRGVLLETLVTDAGPAYPASLLNTKNELLRVTATVGGAGGQELTFAVGELDQNFGNHPALVALARNGKPIAAGPELVVPGDRFPARFLPRVSKVTVGIATAPATTTAPSTGSSVAVIFRGRTVTLSAARLARLPSAT